MMLSLSGKWYLVSSLFKPERAPVENKAHAEWLKNNKDCHPAKEILVVLEGKSFNSLNSTTYPALPGTIFLFNSYEEHDKKYSPATPYSIHLWIALLKDHAIAHIMHVKDGRVRNATKKTMIIDNMLICRLLEQEWDSLIVAPLNEEMKKGKMLALLYIFFLHMIEQDVKPKKDKPDGDGHQLRIIRAMQQHINSNYGRGMTVEGLAKIAGYSKFHFFRLFKKHTGLNVNDCINASRLNKTQEMMRDGFLQKQIASELGFSCPSAFSNWYSRNRKS
jgi:AraC-like DNA-binding protein